MTLYCEYLRKILALGVETGSRNSMLYIEFCVPLCRHGESDKWLEHVDTNFMFIGEPRKGGKA